jgi:hypothetical protein
VELVVGLCCAGFRNTIAVKECRLLGCYAVCVFLRSVLRLIVTANVVPSSPIFSP